MKELGDIERISQKLRNWYNSFVDMLPNLVVAVLIFLAFLFIARLIHSLIQKYLGKISDKVTLNRLFASVVYTLIVLIGSFIALSTLQLDRTVTSLLAGAGIVGLALSFAFQDIATNFISGIFLAFHSPFQIGDVVETSGFKGIVEKVDLRISAIRTFQGQMVYIPNKDIFQNPIINYTEIGRRRIDLGVGVSYGDDLQKVEDLSIDTVRKLEFVLEQYGIHVLFKEFGDSSINFNLIFWVHYSTELQFLKDISETIKSLKLAFDTHQVTIPFPIRTLDFGIKGGEKLSDMILNPKKE